MDKIESLINEKKWLLQETITLLSLISTPILVVDHQGSVVHTNTFAENVWGRSQMTLINKRLLELLESTAASKLIQFVEKGKPIIDFRVQIKDSTEVLYPYCCRLHPLIVNKRAVGAVLQFTKRVLVPSVDKQKKYATRYSFTDIRGNSEGISALKAQAEKVAKSDSTILIRGESGTGKEVLAQAIHGASHRQKGPFVAINCAAIPESLLESELFGYEEGSFTGAKKGGKPGRFEMAHGGTLFLDEIGDMPLFLQAKLLRVLQERRTERVGGSDSIPIDVRVIAATHKDLETMIANQQFREDLYFRLNVIPFSIPPLRERMEDLYELIQYFMKRHGERLGKEPKRISSQALTRLYQYHWPGNIRELENVIEYIVNLEIGDLVTISSLPSSHRYLQVREDNDGAIEKIDLLLKKGGFLDSSLLNTEKSEAYLIEQAILRYGNSTEGKRKAAEALGMSIATLYRRLKAITREKKFSK
ncbi:sigma 54-interacting transcriptional regulator [Aneurinibacillus sp. Ricciae_BoGa-3]|uniref:sigma-54 interaction domain-containing protein n=1 Tax=Aneurinibacillus sp. Ricciae_BoGa-3 TaxID=3022697 RepID=UPI002341B9F0|nr:sigma 54-interacting transcriptional regulator [Aneurinibacillus sp. Ricciae_BoGa-3]WCK52620.1 sigma 54-interacting transcriptional regulator [Aneurinibacillus sp. Ricciae_BoGa-3]